MPCCFENHSGLIAFIVCCESGIENKKKPGRHVEMLGMFDHALVLPINPVMNQRLLSVLVKPEQHCVHLPAQSYRPVGKMRQEPVVGEVAVLSASMQTWFN